MSRLLFALYVAPLGARLHGMKEGIKMGAETISALFFADDLVLISKTPKRGMERLLRTVDSYCKDFYMKLSVSKTFILSNGVQGVCWSLGDDSPDLEETLSAKYLGIDIQVCGRNLVSNRERIIKSAVQRYAYAILGLSRCGLDRSMLARVLWERCAIPAILYGSDAMTLTQSAVRQIEQIQSVMGGFILQTP